MKALLDCLSLALACVLIVGPGCRSEDANGPPEIRLGHDECRECGMIISEEKSSCAVVIEDRGRREPALFDDIGCMLDVEREGRSLIVARFVRDRATGRWISAEAATFIFTDPKRLPTPMGSGMAAFADGDDARRLQVDVGGQILKYAQLLEARTHWMEARYGKPRQPG